MANRRKLKKHIYALTNIVSELCTLESMDAPCEMQKKYAEIYQDIMDTYFDTICRINHTEPNNAKAYYKKLHDDFGAKIRSFLKQLEELR